MSDSVKLGYTHTRLLVSDFPACFRFYRDTLGLKPHVGDESGPYAEFRMGNIVLALFVDFLMGEAIGRPIKACDDCPQFVLCMRVDSVDETYKALMARGVKFLAPPTDRPSWAVRTAQFSDPDGNIIEINQPL